MSGGAVRRALGWLWAAVWLRWRLAAVRARRLFGAVRRALAGGRSAAGVGASFQLEAAAVPVAGVDYDIGELSPELLGRLERTRAELLDSARAASAAGTRRRRGRRRRTFSLTVAALVTLTVLGAGATALMTGSTGVPAVDRLLGIYSTERDDTDSRPKTDYRPTTAGPVIEFDTPLLAGDQMVEATTYVQRDGRVCSAVTQRARANAQDAQGTGSCKSASDISEDLAIGKLSVIVIRVDQVAVLTGVATEDVRGVVGHGPSGSLTIDLSNSWLPAKADIGPVKSFVAVGRESPDKSTQTGAPPALYLRNYRFRVTLEDGRKVTARPR